MLAVLVGLAPLAWGQDVPEIEWSPIVEVRHRLTVDDPDIDDAAAGSRSVGQRARLGMEVRRLGVSARVSVQEASQWTATSDVATLGGFAPSFAEGWVRLEGDLTRNVGAVATIGRQAITLHEGRILGEDDFQLEGQFFDAVRLVGRAAPVSVEYVNARRFLSRDEDPLGLGVNVFRVGLATENPVTTWTADALWVVDARRTTATTSTAGLWCRLDSGRWRGRGEGYLQTSAAGTATLVALSAGWVFGPNERLVLHARYDGLSGDPSDEAGGITAWQPVLGDSRRFNGLLGRFATPGDNDRRGLADAHLVVETRFAPQLATVLTLHRFWSALDGGAFGSEIDGTAHWSFSPFATAGLGAAWFAPDDPTAADPQRLFAYLELDVAF